MKDFRGPPLGSQTAGGEEKRIGFEFSGTAGGYFRIYMNNAMLTMLTVGLYGPWAKVRRRRYFYGNTSLLGYAFDYDARPLMILISRLLVLGAFIFISYASVYLAGFVDGDAELGLSDLLWLLALGVLVPFAVVRGRGFNARYTTHRSVRFSFARIYTPMYKAFFVYWGPLVLFNWYAGRDFLVEDAQENVAEIYRQLVIHSSVQLGYAFLVWPFWQHAWHRIQIDQLSFGKLQCRFVAPLKTYLKYYYPVLALGMVLAAASYAIYQPLADGAVDELPIEEQLDQVEDIFIALIAMVVVAWFAVYKVFASFVTPVFWSSIELGDDGGRGRLASTVRPWVLLLKIQVVNLVLTIVTLGMYYPIAQVRQWRYLARNTSAVLSPELEQVSGLASEDLSPLMAEYGDVEGVDIDFGTI